MYIIRVAIHNWPWIAATFFIMAAWIRLSRCIHLLPLSGDHDCFQAMEVVSNFVLNRLHVYYRLQLRKKTFNPSMKSNSKQSQTSLILYNNVLIFVFCLYLCLSRVLCSSAGIQLISCQRSNGNIWKTTKSNVKCFAATIGIGRAALWLETDIRRPRK